MMSATPSTCKHRRQTRLARYADDAIASVVVGLMVLVLEPRRTVMDAAKWLTGRRH